MGTEADSGLRAAVEEWETKAAEQTGGKKQCVPGSKEASIQTDRQTDRNRWQPGKKEKHGSPGLGKCSGLSSLTNHLKIPR